MSNIIQILEAEQMQAAKAEADKVGQTAGSTVAAVAAVGSREAAEQGQQQQQQENQQGRTQAKLQETEFNTQRVKQKSSAESPGGKRK